MVALRWGTDDDTLSLGMSPEAAAAGTAATRIELEEGDKERRLAAIRADRARKKAALAHQAALKKQLIEGGVRAAVESGTMAVGAVGEAKAAKAGTYGGLTERSGEIPVELEKLKGKKGIFGSAGRKRARLEAEQRSVAGKIGIMEQYPWATGGR